MIGRQQIVQLSLREYLPLLLMVGLWALVLLVIGPADTARLLAATVAMRAVQMLTHLSTASSLKLRMGAPRDVRRQAKRFAMAVQGVVLLANFLLAALLVLALEEIGQSQIAAFLPLIAIGLPARALRHSDVRVNSPYFRLALSGGGLAAAAAAWAGGLGAPGMALAFGAREWIAYVVVRWWPKSPKLSAKPSHEPMTLGEVARITAIAGRRMLTYRISKVALTVFGPAGNFAARTGRGLNWHRRIEPYLPHRLSGFVLFAILAVGAAVAIAVHGGQPAAMIGAAGLLQLGAAAANVAMMWRWLPDRHDPGLVIDEDEDV